MDLNQVVSNLGKMLARVIQADINLRLNLSPGLPPIEADAVQLEQVLLNLVINARDAMPNGGRIELSSERLQVTAEHARRHSLAVAGDFVCLTVKDNGIGIPGEFLERIFEPFFTRKGEGKGSGLGLASAQGIIRQHQGWIEVQSEPDQGTAFLIYLPARPDLRLGSDVENVPSSMLRGHETVLLVEDDPGVRDLIQHILRRNGYNVLEADSGRRALQIWEEHQEQIELLLTDMIMPDMLTGQKLIEQLRLQKPDLKVILASGYSNDLIDLKWAKEARVHFLSKPFSAQLLVQRVRQCLDES